MPAAAGTRRRARLPLVLVLPSLVAAAVALLPLGYLAVRALENGPGYAADLLLQGRTAALAARSIALAAVVTAASLAVGTSLAWLVTRTDLPGRRVWALVAAMPLAIPTYVAASMWLAALPEVAGFGGAALVLTLCCYPYVYLPVAAALDRADPALEEVARALGRGPTRTLLTVTLRQARPAAAAGGLLVALYVLSDFGAVSILRYDTFTRVIYTSYRASFDRVAAAVLGCLLVALTVAIVAAEARTRGRASQARLGAGAARAHRRARLGPAGTGAALAWALAVAALALGVPLGSLAYWIAAGSSAGVDLGALTGAAAQTVWVAALGAVLTTALAIPVGVLAARHRGRPVRLIEQAAYAGHALPGIVVALALVAFAVNYALPLYQRTPVLVLAYAVLFLPAAVGAVRASVALCPPRLEEVARSLGRTPWQALRQVTLPLAAPGVAAGAALVFLTAMKELPATLLLRPTGVETLATQLWSATGVGRYGEAAPYAALLIGLAAVPTLLLGLRGAALPAAATGEPAGVAGGATLTGGGGR